MDEEFTRQVRHALANLYDPAALQANRLARLLVSAPDHHTQSAGHELRDRLLTAVESLKPTDQVDIRSRPWLLYRILKLRYVEARDPTAVQLELALSKSQYYREHEAALAAASAVLWQAAPEAHAQVADFSQAPDRVDTPASGDGSRAGRQSHAGALVLGGVGFALVGALAILLVRGLAGPSVTSGAVTTEMARADPAVSVSAPTGSLALYAGGGPAGHVNGAGSLARFAGSFGLAVDGGGTVYVADTGNHVIRSITTTGLVLDLAGSGIEGYADGPRAVAQFSSPNAVTVGPDGTVYVGDAGNLRIRAVAPSGIVSTLAGSGEAGYLDGIGDQAQFAVAGAIVADPSGTLYMPDRFNSVIRKITPGGVVTTYAGSAVRGHRDGPLLTAQFNVPMRMGADPLGNVYVLDTGDNAIRKLTPDGYVSTVAGGTEPGFADGPAAEARFSGDILGITADAGGNLYVMDAGNRRIRRVTSDGMVSTMFEVTDPDQTPGNIKLDRAGTMYLSDREHNAIYRLRPLAR